MRANKLSWANRLHHPSDFKKFFHEPQVLRLGWVTVFRIPNDLGRFRLGITFKTRASGVSRSRIKRVIREAVRQSAPAVGNHDYNVVIHRVPTSQTSGEAGVELIKRLKSW